MINQKLEDLRNAILQADDYLEPGTPEAMLAMVDALEAMLEGAYQAADKDLQKAAVAVKAVLNPKPIKLWQLIKLNNGQKIGVESYANHAALLNDWPDAVKVGDDQYSVEVLWE